MCNFALTRKFRAIVFPSGWDSYKFLSGIIRDSGSAASVAGLEFVGKKQFRAPLFKAMPHSGTKAISLCGVAVYTVHRTTIIIAQLHEFPNTKVHFTHIYTVFEQIPHFILCSAVCLCYNKVLESLNQNTLYKGEYITHENAQEEKSGRSLCRLCGRHGL